MSITLGCLGLGVAKQGANYREAEAACSCNTGEAVPQVVDANILSRLRPDAAPRLLQIDKMRLALNRR